MSDEDVKLPPDFGYLRVLLWEMAQEAAAGALDIENFNKDDRMVQGHLDRIEAKMKTLARSHRELLEATRDAIQGAKCVAANTPRGLTDHSADCCPKCRLEAAISDAEKL